MSHPHFGQAVEGEPWLLDLLWLSVLRWLLASFLQHLIFSEDGHETDWTGRGTDGSDAGRDSSGTNGDSSDA